MTRALRTLAAFLLLIPLAGCPSVAQRVAIRSCQFNLQSVKFERITPFEVTLGLTVGVFNPNAIEVVLDRFDYVVMLDGLRFVDGESRHGIQVPVNKSRNVHLSVRANLIDIAQVADRIRRGGSHSAALRGTAYIDVPWGELPFPVEVARQF